MNDRVNKVSAIHSAISNMLIGTLTGSVLSSIYYVTQFIEKVNWKQWYNVNYLIGFINALIYYFLLLIAYKDLFELYNPLSTYSTKIIPEIDAKCPWVKHFNYLSMFIYLVLFAYLPVFMMSDVVMFLWLFAVVSFLDLTWSSLVRAKLRHISIPDKSFSRYLGKWYYGDRSFLCMSILLALMLPGIRKAYKVHGEYFCLMSMGFFLGILVLYIYLSFIKDV